MKQRGAKPKSALEDFYLLENGKLDFEKVDPASLFLLDDFFGKSKKAVSQYGMISLTNSEIKERSSWLFDQYPLEFRKGERVDSGQYWRFLERLKRPINSMVIIDPYLFGDRNESTKRRSIQALRFNLKPLLDQLLPETQISTKLQLTIVVYFKQFKGETPREYSDRKSELRGYFDEVYSMISEIRRPYEVSLSVVSTNHFKRPHDRHIITNSYWLFSGFGFNLFSDKGAIHSSHIIVQSIASQGGKSMFTELKKTMSAVAIAAQKSMSSYPNGHIYIGEKPFQNRLIEAYFE
ncbi:MAG: hypothetical protein KI786_17415 [Mameliella sp.]|nr:hypothetical protein [Phaeodactylibacter sp.]